MLTVDPRSRITTSDILAHPWLHLEDEIEVPIIDGPVGSPGLRKSTMTVSKRSTNLNNALRLLSGHVNELKTEKFAMSFTKLVSSLETSVNPGGQSMLMQLAVPMGKASNSLRTASTTSSTQKRSAEDEMMIFQNPEIKEALAATIGALGDSQGKLSLEQFLYLLKRYAFSNASTSTSEDGDEGGETARPGANPGTGLALMFLCR